MTWSPAALLAYGLTAFEGAVADAVLALPVRRGSEHAQRALLESVVGEYRTAI